MIKRKVEHYEFTEYSRKKDCLFSEVKLKKLESGRTETDYKNEVGKIIYSTRENFFYVPQKIFEAGGFSAGYVNGKYQEFNIYY